MKRIMYVIGSLERGGAETHLVQVACALKERGWSPEFFLLSAGGPLKERLDLANIPVECFCRPTWLEIIGHPRWRSFLGLFLTLVKLSKVLLSKPPNVIHFFLPTAYVLGGVAAVITGMRPRLMSRRSRNHYQRAFPISTRIERFLHPRMDLICGNSAAVIKDLETEKIPGHRLRLIYNGIDLARFSQLPDRAVLRLQMGIEADALVFVMVANLIPYKGHADLLAAFGMLRDKLLQPWLLLCVGRDDAIGMELRKQSDSLGLGERVRWLGSRSDVPELLALSDIGVLCSHEEGFSNAVLEGMAAGLPMVVTDVGGNSEAVIDGEHGLVVPPRDPQRLADALLCVAQDPERKIMGKRGRQRVEQSFSMAACVDAYERLYREVLLESH